MARECPIGTIHEWANGTMIKAHDPVQPFSSGWIPLQKNVALANIGHECDDEAKEILSHKEPINGERFLDHMIDEYVDDNGDHPYSADAFKQYFGYYGAGKYAFTNEFSRRFMANKMRLSEMIAQALSDANEDAGGNKSLIKLNDNERETIRREIKENFVEDTNVFSMKDAMALQAIVKNTKEKLEEGEDIKDPYQAKIYKKMKAIADGMDQEYHLFKETMKLKDECIATINEVFTDNWGISDSFKEHINKKFGDYVRKYKERIQKDSVNELQEVLGVTLDMGPEEFYNTIIKRYNGMTADQIEEYDEVFRYIVYMRFATNYNKIVEGDWTLKCVPALKNLEIAINELPAGHFLNNDQLEMVTSKDYAGGSNGSYAWYNGGEKRINFSADCINLGSVFGVLANPREFKSTMLHEIGHSVSQKFGRDSKYDYKKFVVECGWTYESKELRAGMTATGDQKSIPRTGSNSTVTLISEYASKAPEESFAEYYSFYANNKDVIDKFIASKDKRFLEQESKWTAAVTDETRDLGHIMREHKLSVDDHNLKAFNEEFIHLSDRGKDIDFTLTSPWVMSKTKSEIQNYNVSYIRDLRRADQQQTVFCYKDGKNRVVFHGGNDMEIAKMNKKLISTVEIPKEMYMKMKEKGLRDIDITNCLVTKHQNEYPKKQTSPPEERRGLYHRDDFVDARTLATNRMIFESMQKVYNSPELAKAIADMFGGKGEDIEKGKVHKYLRIEYKNGKKDYVYEEEKNGNKSKIENFAKQIENELPVQVRLEHIAGKEEGFVLKDLEVNKDATGGIAGYQAMMKIFKFADENNFIMSLVPAGSYRNSKKKLDQWYEGLGFKENTNKDSEHKIMIRQPKGKGDEEKLFGNKKAEVITNVQDLRDRIKSIDQHLNNFHEGEEGTRLLREEQQSYIDQLDKLDKDTSEFKKSIEERYLMGLINEEEFGKAQLN